MHEKQFTPASANAALPLVRRIVADVVHHHARVADLATGYQKQKREPAASQVALNDSRQKILDVTSQRDACVAELVELGVQTKDVATGLVDFPGTLDGEPVLFCWRLGEDRVEFFHTEAEGFSGRRPIPEPAHV